MKDYSDVSLRPTTARTNFITKQVIRKALIHFESTCVACCCSRHLRVDLVGACVVGSGGGDSGRGAIFRSAWTTEEAVKCSTKLDRHDVVEDGVYGAVRVDHEATEEQEPEVLEALTGERIVDDIGSVWQPENSKDADNDTQHLRYLHNTQNAAPLHKPRFIQTACLQHYPDLDEHQ